MNLKKCDIFPNGLAIQWADASEIFIEYNELRDACPCAYCSGETDVFGNVYKGPPQSMNAESYTLKGIQPVGHYAIRPFWNDGHRDGIYPFEFLKKLCDALDK